VVASAARPAWNRRDCDDEVSDEGTRQACLPGRIRIVQRSRLGGDYNGAVTAAVLLRNLARFRCDTDHSRHPFHANRKVNNS
jgi:hypothetical protein